MRETNKNALHHMNVPVSTCAPSCPFGEHVSSTLTYLHQDK